MRAVWSFWTQLMRAGRIIWLRERDHWLPDCAAGVGYTHLIGNARRNRMVLERIEEVVRRDRPDLYRRCVDCSERAPRRGRGERAS